MTPDCELLRRYAGTRSEEAFAELVQRHVNLVYSAALRQVNGDAHLAQDVAQTVFTDLARKAASLARRATLTGWLYTSAHFAAAKIARTENRRRDREEKFMREPTNENVPEAGRVTPCAPDWDKIRPMLDEVMHQLKETDREAILLRYFENRPFAEIGEKFGLNENCRPDAGGTRAGKTSRFSGQPRCHHRRHAGLRHFRQRRSARARKSGGDADDRGHRQCGNGNLHPSENYDPDQTQTRPQRAGRCRRDHRPGGSTSNAGKAPRGKRIADATARAAGSGQRKSFKPSCRNERLQIASG